MTFNAGCTHPADAMQGGACMCCGHVVVAPAHQPQSPCIHNCGGAVPVGYTICGRCGGSQDANMPSRDRMQELYSLRDAMRNENEPAGDAAWPHIVKRVQHAITQCRRTTVLACTPSAMTVTVVIYHFFKGLRQRQLQRDAMTTATWAITQGNKNLPENWGARVAAASPMESNRALVAFANQVIRLFTGIVKQRTASVREEVLGIIRALPDDIKERIAAPRQRDAGGLYKFVSRNASSVTVQDREAINSGEMTSVEIFDKLVERGVLERVDVLEHAQDNVEMVAAHVGNARRIPRAPRRRQRDEEDDDIGGPIIINGVNIDAPL